MTGPSQIPEVNPVSFNQRILEKLYNLGTFDLIHSLQPRRLTVLNYHRINDPFNLKFDTFKPNISATPINFAAQMDYIKERFNVISIGEIIAWLSGENELPLNAALITFDDGYYDNLKYALPILKERDIPALIFLTTDFIGQAKLYDWDMIAYCFHHTRYDNANLPLIGQQSWTDVTSRDVIMLNFIKKIKLIPADVMKNYIKKLPSLLDVTIPNKESESHQLNWSQVKRMESRGIDFGTHTMSHPILTRISVEEVLEELSGSKSRLEIEIGKPIVSFAYPNGTHSDFNSIIERLVEEVGYEIAFTLLPGLNSYKNVQKNPFEVKRIFISYKDDIFRFAFKVSGYHRYLYRE